MRIIDKNTDFYDFYQNVYVDKTFTFDRRDSFILTKRMVCDRLLIDRYRYWSWKEKRYKNGDKYYMLLQICNTFWLFRLHITKFNEFDRPIDYEVELVHKWRNFNKERKLITLDAVEIRRQYYYDNDEKNKTEDLVASIDRNDYKITTEFNHCSLYVGDVKVERHIPILTASGLAPLMDAHEVFLAFEEYFSLEKSDSERREPLGTTDTDKVESHGFDKKTSFRGK